METITLKLFFDDPEENVSIQFSKQELSLLENFLECARKIESSKIVQLGMPFSFNIQHEQGKDATVTFTLPDWQFVESYLHRLRPVILQKEKTNFYKICDLLSRRIELPRVRKAIKEEKQLYQGTGIHSIMKFSINNELIASEDMLQKYLNAFEFHRDDAKRESLEKFNAAFPLEAMKVFLFWLLQEKGGSILRVSEFVRKIVDTANSRQSEPLKAYLLASHFRKE